MTNYAKLTEKVELYAKARAEYWQDLEKVLELFIPKYLEFLGLTESGWKVPGGRSHSYLTLGKNVGEKFERAQLFELPTNEKFQIEFMLYAALQVGQSSRELEPVHLPMTLERQDGDYVFIVEAFGSFGQLRSVLTQSQFATGQWSKLFEDLTSRIASEFEIGRFA